jgi:hypothetical protein
MNWTIETINSRIRKEISDNVINSLRDENLMKEYSKSESVKKKIDELDVVLEKNNIEYEKRQQIIKDYIPNLIPAGLKGSVKGRKFNRIVMNHINGMGLDSERFTVRFEEKCDICPTDEKPDWYIMENETGKVIIGMNQLDLWGGGQQFNRGFKYLKDNKINTDKSRLLCVVCNSVTFNSDKNKTYEMFKIGFTNNTLCYIRGMRKIITSFFE